MDILFCFSENDLDSRPFDDGRLLPFECGTSPLFRFPKQKAKTLKYVFFVQFMFGPTLIKETLVCTRFV